MKALITGANGFLGRAVVEAFLTRGHSVRALVRPTAELTSFHWPPTVEVFRADLRVHPQLIIAFDNVDVVVHLAAVVIGDDTTHFANTIGGTERLLQAMSLSKTRRIILASSMSVYGWRESSRTVDENSPPPADLYQAGAYAVAKVWQERLTRRQSIEQGWSLTVLRPGTIWGPGHESVANCGPSGKHLQFVIGPGRQLPLTYVDNCADAFVRAAEHPAAAGETFNVVDGFRVSAWRYAGKIARGRGVKIVRVPVPYWITKITALCADALRHIVFGERGKLPALLRPQQLAYMRPLRFSNRKLVGKLDWSPPVDFGQAVRLCFAETNTAAVRQKAASQ